MSGKARPQAGRRPAPRKLERVRSRRTRSRRVNVVAPAIRNSSFRGWVTTAWHRCCIRPGTRCRRVKILADGRPSSDRLPGSPAQRVCHACHPFCHSPYRLTRRPSADGRINGTPDCTSEPAATERHERNRTIELPRARPTPVLSICGRREGLHPSAEGWRAGSEIGPNPGHEPVCQRDPAPHPMEPERLSGASPQTRMGPGDGTSRICRHCRTTQGARPERSGGPIPRPSAATRGRAGVGARRGGGVGRLTACWAGRGRGGGGRRRRS